jgi:tetratricopeptide (TPR) repeat protein
MASKKKHAAADLSRHTPGTLTAVIPLFALVLVLAFISFSRNAVWITDPGLWEDAVRKLPNKPRALNNLGFAYNALNRYDHSIEAFDRSLALDPDNIAALLNRGLAYHEMKRYDKAIADYSKVVLLAPTLAKGWFNRGLAYHESGRLKEAIVDFSRAIAYDPGE